MFEGTHDKCCKWFCFCSDSIAKHQDPKYNEAMTSASFQEPAIEEIGYVEPIITPPPPPLFHLSEDEKQVVVTYSLHNEFQSIWWC